MRINKFLVILCFLLSVVACQKLEFNEDILPDEKLELTISGVIDHIYQTRANDEGFVDGDRMGVYVVDYENGQKQELTTDDNRASNMKYTYDEQSGVWNGAGTIYWRDKDTPVDVYGYYPFRNVVTSVQNFEFEVKSNQNIKASDGEMSPYEASDFLWAKTESATYGKPITLTYGHLMAGVKVNLQKGDGFSDIEWGKLSKVVTLDNAIRKSVINLSEGTVLVSGQYDYDIVLSDEGGSYRGVVVPQTVEAGKSLIGVNIDGISYSLKKDDAMNYTSGKLHVFTIRVDKREISGDYELSIINEQIAPWENDKSSHSFEGKAYVVVHVDQAGMLKESMLNAGVDISTVRNLKITGKLKYEDFNFIRNEMSQLEAINIKETDIVEATQWPYRSGKDVLPEYAFQEMSLLRSVVLPDGIISIGKSSLRGLRLTSTLIIPNSVKIIDEFAFYGTKCEVVLPDYLETVNYAAFAYSQADGMHVTGELKLPNTLKYIGADSFWCAKFYGTFSLPSDLEYLGVSAFAGCGVDLEGDIVIPPALKVIKEESLSLNFKNGTNLYLHDGVEKIEKNAFGGPWSPGIKFNNSLNLPSALTYIGEHTFMYCKISGHLKLPENISYIGDGAFHSTHMTGVLNIPSSVNVIRGGDGAFAYTDITELNTTDGLEQIGDRTFMGCHALTKVFLAKNIGYIGDYAFADNSSLSLLVCMAEEPPVLGENVFSGVDYEHLILQVPSKSLKAYRNSTGWKNFKYITPYHELAVGLSEIKALNKGVTRSVLVRAEGDWEVQSCPEWCSVSPMSGGFKEEIDIVVNQLNKGSENREGRIVFRLKDKDYTTNVNVMQYDYEIEEGREIILQEAKAGAEEIPIFIIGDGFAAEQIINGEYLEIMNQQIEYFFDIEPYRSYKDYFTVSTAVVCSPDSGVSDLASSKLTALGTIYDAGTGIYRNNTYSFLTTVSNISGHINYDNWHKALFIVVVNDKRFGGNVEILNDATTICFCPLSSDSYPYDQRGVIQHFAGGQGFGKLAQENVSHYDFLSLCSCPYCNKMSEYNRAKTYGWYENVSISGKMNEVPWSHLIFHSKYSHIVDIYEGGLGHARGIHRSEINSCMNTFIPYYNTISREAIVKRIMEYAGKEYVFEDFVENDKIELPE